MLVVISLKFRPKGWKLVTEGSLNRSMEKAVSHYSSLFKLPSLKRVISSMSITCMGGGLLATVNLLHSSDYFLNGLALGASLLFMNLGLDYVVSSLVLGEDRIFNFRRTEAVSLICMILWFLFAAIGAIISTLLGLSWWVRFCLLGFSAVTMLRLIVFYSASLEGYGRMLLASFLQPILCIVPFLVLWTRINYPFAFDSIVLFLISSAVIGLLASFLFIFFLDRVGKKTLGISSFSLLKAFLLNWVLDLNDPFEKLLEKLGEEQDTQVSMLKFCTSVPKVFIVVPSVHPGPFKNIGSSVLPSLLKASLEKKINCIVCVPHGVFGHELDLASQAQNQKLIDRVFEFEDLEGLEAKASSFVTVTDKGATACCQIFGKSVLISFTLAPETTEDLPQEVGLHVQQEAEKHGLTCSIVVNAHNSLDGGANMQDSLTSLKTVATTCLAKASSLERMPFSIGAASVNPADFTIGDGIGPGGITSVVVKVGGQKTAYITIDGNNMVSGLRERMLSDLCSLGIGNGEIFTTDTHIVNALILGRRGYHPVGEAVDIEKLIAYVKETTNAALSSLERVESAYCGNLIVRKVKVIGEKRLETLCLLIDQGIRRAKRIAAPIFVTAGAFLMLILLSI